MCQWKVVVHFTAHCKSNSGNTYERRKLQHVLGLFPFQLPWHSAGRAWPPVEQDCYVWITRNTVILFTSNTRIIVT